jgi:hypothetical protein
MQFVAQALNKFDRAMGIESVACAPDNPQALALVEAGFSLLETNIEITPDTKLSEIAAPAELLAVLGNLDYVYLRRGDLALGNDIINDETVGKMITHLDASRVSELIETMRADERRSASDMVHAQLDDLDKIIKA